MERLDFAIENLGPTKYSSPMGLSSRYGDRVVNYVEPSQRVLYHIETSSVSDLRDCDALGLLELAGPREQLYYDPSQVKAAIVTCGGLCPGLNSVIRSVTLCLRHHYGVKTVLGIPFGYRGLLPEFNLTPIDLTLDRVSDIHRMGGTVLGSSRGYGQQSSKMVDTLIELGIDMLFVIGGDGTQRGALGLSKEIERRGAKIAVVGIPKTIDNDISFVQRSFGFETAVGRASEAAAAAHIEARGAINGVGLVKLMGRQSGFIAAQTALANTDVNVVLVPEVSFELEGACGLLAHLEQRLASRGHAVILVAEGAGQELLPTTDEKDASGNVKLADVGPFLKDAIARYFKDKDIPVGLKYIDPSYIIRSAPANPNDTVYCTRLGANAVHAAMAGKTGLIVSLMHDRFVHVPIELAVAQRHVIDPESSYWRDVVEATGQPLSMVN